MNNAEKFRRTFGAYATEVWSKPENEFLDWLNKEYYALGLDSPTNDDNSPEVVGNLNTLQRSVKCSKPCDLICLAIIVVCDIALMFLKWYQKRLNNKEKKYEIAIGKYDEELNQKNKSIAIGQSKTADMRGEEE